MLSVACPTVSSCCQYCCWCCRSFTYEEFITAQDKFQKAQAQQLAVCNEEVACAIEDVISLVEVRGAVATAAGVGLHHCASSKQSNTPDRLKTAANLSMRHAQLPAVTIGVTKVAAVQFDYMSCCFSLGVAAERATGEP
jgi:hypothetical protein